MKITEGKVLKINVKGVGGLPNSAGIEFTIKTKTNQTFMILSDYAPQVFSAMATLITAAYFAKEKIRVEYVEVAGETDRAVGIYIGKE